MTVNFRKLMSEVPRPLEVAARDEKNSVPIGRESVSPREQARRAEPLMPLIASGHVPLDEQAADVVARYLDEFHQKQSRA